jgi:hypothetical protein
LRTAVIGLAVLGLAGTAQAQTCSPPLKQATEIDLYFGRESVSDEQWSSFLADEVTPRFPEGLSALDVAGQWRAPSGAIMREKSKLLTIVVLDEAGHQAKVEAVVSAYKKRFNQQSVFRVEKAVCAGD